jgi:hypothetical protein
MGKHPRLFRVRPPGTKCVLTEGPEDLACSGDGSQGQRPDPIPAQAAGLGTRDRRLRRANGPIHSLRHGEVSRVRSAICLIPDIPLVELDPVLPEKLPVFILKRPRPVMFLLAVDVGHHCLQILRPD